MLKYRGTRQTSGWTDLTTLLVGCFRFAQARDGVCHIGLTCRLVRTDYAGQDANLQHRWISIHENDMPKERAAQIQPVSLISKPRIARGMQPPCTRINGAFCASTAVRHRSRSQYTNLERRASIFSSKAGSNSSKRPTSSYEFVTIALRQSNGLSPTCYPRRCALSSRNTTDSPCGWSASRGLVPPPCSWSSWVHG